jgi:hypothetical protein
VETSRQRQLARGRKAKATRPAGAAGKTVLAVGHRSRGGVLSSRALRKGDGREGKWGRHGHCNL